MIFIHLVVVIVFAGGCTSKQRKPPAVGPADMCQGSSCKTGGDQTSSDASRVEELTATINTLKSAITNKQRLSAAEIDSLQEQLREKSAELQTVSEQNTEIKTLEQIVDDLQQQLQAKEQSIDELNASHQTEINTLAQQLANLRTEIGNISEDAEAKENKASELSRQLDEANKQVLALKANNADVSRLQREIQELRQQLAETSDSPSPESPEETATETPADDSATDTAETSSACPAKLCAYYVSYTAPIGRSTEGRIVVEKGAQGGDLQITEGIIRDNASDKLAVAVLVSTSESNQDKCYRVVLEQTDFIEPAPHKPLIEQQDNSLCAKN